MTPHSYILIRGVEPIIEFILSFSMKIISVYNGYMLEYDY